MKKILYILLFLPCFLRAQTPVTPTGPVPSTWYYDIATHRWWINSGLGYGWRQIVTKKQLDSALTASGVASFNTRAGAVTLLSQDVTDALGFTPYHFTGTSFQYADGTGAYQTFPTLPDFTTFITKGAPNQTITQVPFFSNGYSADHFLVTGTALSEIQHNLQVDGAIDIGLPSFLRNTLNQYDSNSGSTYWTHTVGTGMAGYTLTQQSNRTAGTTAVFNFLSTTNGGTVIRANGDTVIWSSDPRLHGGGTGGGGTVTSITPAYGFLFHTPITGSGSLIIDSTLLATKTYIQNYAPTKAVAAATYALQTTAISPGFGMTGGGSLATGRTLTADSTILKTKARALVDYNNLSTRITANNTAIGARQQRLLPADPGAGNTLIATGDSLNMALYKLQHQLSAAGIGSYVDLTTTQANIAGLKTFTTGVSSQNYTVTNSNGTSTYQLYNDSVRMVVKPYNQSAPVASGYDITQDLPSGYVTDGSVDYTSIVQAALNNHLHVSMPPFIVGIYFATATGLILQNGATVDFPTGAKLKMLPNNQPTVVNGSYNYGFFKMTDNFNITLNNVTLEGDLLTHLTPASPVDGSGGMSIYIFGGHDIIINGGTIKNSLGDGIYVATSSSLAVPTHILINKVDVSNNGRNGISLTSCNFCLIQDPIANYEEKYSPYTGIDIEPSSNRDLVDNIVINNPILLNTPQTANGGIVTQGFSNGLARYYTPGTGQTASTITNKTSNVTVNNPIITGANVGIKVDLHLKSGDTNPNNRTVTGQVIINNPRVSTNWSAPNSAGSIDANWTYTIFNPTLYDKNGVLVSPFSTVQAAFYHNDNQPGSLQIVNQAVNPSPITTVSGVVIPTPPVVSTAALYLKDNDIHDYPGNTFLKSNTGVSLTGSYSNPSWITSLAFSKITGVPTTASTLGLTDNFVYATGTTPLTIGSVPYVDATGKLTQNNTFFYFDNTDGYLGLRATGALPANLTFGNGATEYFSNVADLTTNKQFVSIGWAGNTLHFSSSAAGSASVRPMQFDIGLGVNSNSSLQLTNNGFIETGYSNFPSFNMLRINGNASAPTAVINGNVIGSFGATGYNGTGNSGVTASMQAYAAENWNTTSNGTELIYSVTENGSTTSKSALYILPSRDMVVGQNFATAANFQVVQSTTGIGTISTSGTTVTGSHTEFTNSFNVGDVITANGETKTITAIASDVSMTTGAWTNTNSGVAYTLGGATILQAKGNGNISATLKPYTSGTSLPVIYNSTNNRFETTASSYMTLGTPNQVITQSPQFSNGATLNGSIIGDNWFVNSPSQDFFHMGRTTHTTSIDFESNQTDNSISIVMNSNDATHPLMGVLYSPAYTGTNSLYEMLDNNQANAKKILTTDDLIGNALQANVAGSISGTIIATMPIRDQSIKKVIIQLIGINGTASYTYPSAFTYTPTTTGLLPAGTTITTTSITFSTSGAQTGTLTLEGF